jgi:uncharacterized protein
MIQRNAQIRLKALAAQFPAVVLLGPRQCGKTTLMRHFVDGRYFDLEKPSDLQVFSGDIDFALRRLSGSLIFDEAQLLPKLFSVLRALIDESRSKRGRFFLLGSVSLELVKTISETLAGRVGVLELTPFLYPELEGRRGMKLDTLWLRGGFPDALLAKNQNDCHDWHESYLKTFVERDIARHQLNLSAIDMRRLMTMLAHSHGGLLNASNLGRALGYSYHTVQNVLDLLEGYFLIRKLPPYHANIGKRLVKSPKLYIRDSGMLHSLLGIRTMDQLLVAPARGNSFEGMMIEQIIAIEKQHNPGTGCYFFRTHTGAEVDLILDRGQERIGFEFKAGSSTEPHDWQHLKSSIEAGVIHRGVVVYHGNRSFALDKKISVVPATDALIGKAQW